MSLHLALIGLALAAAQPAPAADTVTMNAGEEVRLRVEGGGPATVEISRAAAGPLSAFDDAALRHIAGPAGKEAVGPNSIPVSADELGTSRPPPPQPDQARLIFVSVVDGQHSLLIIENGYDRALVYRARIHFRGQVQPTDVCLVMPRLRAYEHWPFPIERIELSALRLQDWQPSDGVHCE